MSSSHSSCTTRRISANVGRGKPGWYSLRTSATRSVIRISVSVMPSTSPLRSMALKRRMYCSIMPICSRTVFSFTASSSTTSGESVSGQPMSTASAYSSDARWLAEAMPSSICTRNT